MNWGCHAWPFSLINLLQQNGYETNFFYGGDASFDNMRKFLLKNKIDHIYDETNFPSGYAKMPANNGFSWGYGDKELFNSYLNSKQDSIRSYLNLVLTVSTHSPFLINEQDKYLQSFENRMSELGISENQKKEYRNYKYQYASIMYMDDAIGSFLESYKKRSDFSNTVF